MLTVMRVLLQGSRVVEIAVQAEHELAPSRVDLAEVSPGVPLDMLRVLPREYARLEIGLRSPEELQLGVGGIMQHRAV